MSRAIVLAATVSVMIAIAGCGGDGPPSPVSVQGACAPEQRDSRVIVEGYLRLPETLRLSDVAVIDMYSLLGGGGDRVSIELPVGEGPNQMRRLPAAYSPTSLRVHDRDGREATLNDRVRVTAKVGKSVEVECLLRDAEVELVGGTG